MTTIIETNRSTFERIKSGEITFIVNKLRREPNLDDTIVFQEIDDDNEHTGREEKYCISQIETDGVKNGYYAVAFKPFIINTSKD